MLDRNFYTRVTALVNNTLPTGRDLSDYQWAAAVLAFCQIANITFDYGSSLQEYASTQGGASAVSEIKAFHLADHADPKVFIDFALGRINAIDPVQFSNIKPMIEVPSTNQLETLPDDFAKNYVFTLKIELLSRENMEPHERMLKFLDWMHSDFMFGAPALQFANVYFSPTRQGGMIKKGKIKNAAWDLSLVQNWRRIAIEGAKEDRPVLLISRDKALKTTALRLVAENAEELQKHIVDAWPHRLAYGRLIYDRYCELWANVEANPSARVRPTKSQIEAMTKAMESQLNVQS